MKSGGTKEQRSRGAGDEDVAKSFDTEVASWKMHHRTCDTEPAPQRLPQGDTTWKMRHKIATRSLRHGEYVTAVASRKMRPGAGDEDAERSFRHGGGTASAKPATRSAQDDGAR